MLRSGKPLPVATAQSSEGDSAQGSLGLLQALQGCQSQQRYGGRKLPVHATQSLTPPSAVSTGQEHIPAPAPFLSIPQNSRKGKTEADTTPVPEEGRNETRLPACSFLSDMQPKLPHSLHATPVTWTPSSNIQYPWEDGGTRDLMEKSMLEVEGRGQGLAAHTERRDEPSRLVLQKGEWLASSRNWPDASWSVGGKLEWQPPHSCSS